MSSKRIKVSKQDDVLYEPLNLDTIIGLTSLSNEALSCSSVTGKSPSTAITNYYHNTKYKVIHSMQLVVLLLDIMLMIISKRAFIRSVKLYHVYQYHQMVNY